MNKNQLPLNIRVQKFIVGYLENHYHTDICDTQLHDEFFQEFGGKRKRANWGAERVYKISFWLKRLFDEGVLDRGIVSLSGSWHPGFPKWVYGYTLSKSWKANVK